MTGDRSADWATAPEARLKASDGLFVWNFLQNASICWLMGKFQMRTVQTIAMDALNQAMGLCVAVGVLCVAVSLPAVGMAAEYKVLQYDEQGNVIGVDRTQSDDPAINKGSTPNTSSSGFGSGPSTFDPDTEFEEGEVVVVDPPKGFADKVRARGFKIVETVYLDNLGIVIVRLATPKSMKVKDAIRTLNRAFPGITVDANIRFDPSAGLSRSDANARIIAGWDKLAPDCGKGLKLGMIDSGVDLTHPAFKGQKITYKAFYKPGRQPAPPDHGTSVAGMLVGRADWGGLMPGAELYAANMFEINEKGKKVGSAIGLIKSMDWIASKKVHAVNMSVAGGDNKVVRKALDIAKRQKMLLVASVGNWGRDDKPAYPAAYKEVVAVTALKGKELIYKHANTGKYVDFAAPGVGIWTVLPGGGGKPQSGTSFATPYITVIAAVLARSGKVKTADALRSLLTKVTIDLGKTGKDNVFGQGAVRARPSCK